MVRLLVACLLSCSAGGAALRAHRRSREPEQLGVAGHEHQLGVGGGQLDRTDHAVPVTLSAAVINVKVAVGDVIDPERLLADAEAAVERAKQHGRNRVERVDGYSGVLRPDAPPPVTNT